MRVQKAQRERVEALHSGWAVPHPRWLCQGSCRSSRARPRRHNRQRGRPCHKRATFGVRWSVHAYLDEQSSTRVTCVELHVLNDHSMTRRCRSGPEFWGRARTTGNRDHADGTRGVREPRQHDAVVANIGMPSTPEVLGSLEGTVNDLRRSALRRCTTYASRADIR